MTTGNTQSGQSWEDAVRWLQQQPDKQALVRAAYYDDPLSAAASRFHQSDEWSAMRNLVGKPGKALDIGAGRGIASYALAMDGWEVTALEPDNSDYVGAGAIRQLATNTGLTITVEQTVSERLPFTDATFDLVYGRAVLHHIGGLEAACREFSRVLKPGGRAVFVREHVLSKDDDLEAFFKIHPLHHLYGGENAFRRQVYERALIDGGLRLESVLGPLETEINFAPHTRDSLIAEISGRAAILPFGKKLASLALHLPIFGQAALKALQSVDHRPGRHYSFVAVKP